MANNNNNRQPAFPLSLKHFSFGQINLLQPQPQPQPQPHPVSIEISSSSEGSGSRSDFDLNRSVHRSGAGTSGKKGNKDLFKRIWPLEDEIAVLSGMLKYRREKGADAEDDIPDFLNFIKRDLKGEFTAMQLQYKVGRLRSKYRKNKAKEQEGQAVRAFCRSHEQRAYAWSKAVWGDEAAGRQRRHVHGECSTSVEEGVSRAYAEICEGEREWRKCKVEDLERHCRQLEEQLAKSRFVLSLVKAAQRSSGMI